MAINLQDDILQDFLVEAGEIVELLSEQLVVLEKTPDDGDLLNAIFRGFHTVKGGASFLSLNNLVDVCHKSEDVFNLLRNQKISLNEEMMDVFLQVLDQVYRMFDEIKSGTDPVAVPALLIEQLLAMQSSVTDTKKPVSVTNKANKKSAVKNSKNIKQVSEQFLSSKGDISDEEFESLLDNLHGAGVAPQAIDAQAGNSKSQKNEPISDQEFEKLLGQLDKKEAVEGSAAAQKMQQGKIDDLITEQEFELLLDQLHGKGCLLYTSPSPRD